MLDPESNAISSEFYKPNTHKKGNPVEFKASTISLMLELPPAIYSTITAHINDTLEQEELMKGKEGAVSEAVSLIGLRGIDLTFFVVTTNVAHPGVIHSTSQDRQRKGEEASTGKCSTYHLFKFMITYCQSVHSV